MKVRVIGAGLAGSEAAWTLSKNGFEVELFEMKTKQKTQAHSLDYFGELVCSNSLRSNEPTSAVGLLKQEMQMLDSIVMYSAYKNQIPAGGALGVDRINFAKDIDTKIRSCANITIIEEEISEIDLNIPTIIATGPMTSTKMSAEIGKIIGENYLHFFDAAAPIIEKESLDFNKVYLKSRYDKGEAAYLNAPFTKEEYDLFYEELINAQTIELKEFEKDPKVFEGCMPIEVMAKRGYKTPLFGPMKPVGLEDPKTGKIPYAVVQLRMDNAIGSLYNIVGFQTNLKFGEQKRVFSLIPGFENANFVRYGVMHKNTFLNSPRILNRNYQCRKHENIFFAGQITGVEGYVESAASGILAALNMIKHIKGENLLNLSSKTMIGAMSKYISNEAITNLQPMNANFGIIKPLTKKIRNKKERGEYYNKVSQEVLKKFIEEEDFKV